MAERLYMTALSPTMTEGVIAKWNVAENQDFKAGSVLCEIETDKASMDYEAPKPGVLLKILLPAGGHAAVGDTIAILGKAGEDPGPLLAEIAGAAGAPGAPTAGAAKAGPSAAALGAALAQPEASHLSPPPPASPSPKVERLEKPIPSGGASALAGEGGGRPGGGPRAAVGFPPSSPLARKLARDKGLDLRLVPGSGPGGRVLRRDVEGFEPSSQHSPPAIEPSAPGREGRKADRRIPVSGKRAIIARRLSESFFAAPHYYLKKKVLVDRLFEARAGINKSREFPLSLNSFIVKLVAETLKRHPALNASWEGDSIVERGSIDIGLAVALPDGLITPVVRDAGGKGVGEIEAELAALIEKARSRGLAPAEYEGASFTITNLGSFGIDEFTAIINPPGSAILALGAARREAEPLEDGSIAVRRVMRLTLGCDHRSVDGAVGAAFLRDLAASIEEPLKALL